MFGNLLSLILPLFSVVVPATPSVSSTNLDDLLNKVEQRYNSTRTLDAVFEQSFRNKAFRKTQRSSGSVRFAKPGLMEWRYDHPTSRRFVLGCVNHNYLVSTFEYTEVDTILRILMICQNY